MLLTVDDVMRVLKCSQSYAYNVIRTLNKELSKQGYLTRAGKVESRYLMERYRLGTLETAERED